MVSLLNGFSQMGSAAASFAQSAGLAEQKSDLEKQQLELSSQLQEGVQTRMAGVNEGVQTRLAHVQGSENRDTAVTTAAEQSKGAINTATAENALPMSPYQKATTAIQQQEANARTLDASKPVPGGYTGAWMVPDKTSPLGWKMVNSSATAETGPIDKDSNNLTAQTGLSENALAVARGELTGRFAAPYRAELQAWGVKNGVDIDNLIPQVKATNDILKVNLERNNQGGISEREIAGTIATLAPLSDAVGQGEFKKVGEANVWIGQNKNDPNSIKVADQVNRLRNEVANYNAIAGGNLSDSGKPKPTPEDFHQAEALITNGINSGGLKALGESIASSAVKNQQVLIESVDNARAANFKLFNATYHPIGAAPPAGAGDTTPAPTPAAATSPAIPPWVKPGDQYSPSKNKARKSDGTEYGPT